MDYRRLWLSEGVGTDEVKETTMFVTVVSGFCIGAGKDAFPGDVLEVDDKKAADLIYRRYARESTADEAKGYLAGVAKRKQAELKAAVKAEADMRAQQDAEEAARLEAEKAAEEAAKKAGGGQA